MTGAEWERLRTELERQPGRLVVLDRKLVEALVDSVCRCYGDPDGHTGGRMNRLGEVSDA